MAQRNSRRIKILPDRVFHRIWNLAVTEDDKTVFLTKVITGDERVVADPQKYHIDASLWYDVLSGIYNVAHMDMTTIIKASGWKRSEISHYFCIPIRTLEDWCYNKSTPPPYVRLMMIRKFDLLDIGKNVRLKSDISSTYSVYSKASC